MDKYLLIFVYIYAYPRTLPVNNRLPLFKKAVLFAQNSVNITPKSIEIIFDSRNLFCTVMMIHGLKMI